MKTVILLLAGLGIVIPLRAQDASLPQDFRTYLQQIPGSSVSFKMVAVPGSTFLMGSPGEGKYHQEDEGPQTSVTVDSFWIEEHEVTFDEYVMFQNASLDHAPLPDAITRPSPPYVDFSLGMGQEGGYPANSMSQHAALMYCKWLYEKTGVFFRLPTEAEWEYACRAGSETVYPYGDAPRKLSAYGWYAGNSANKYHKIKQLQPNAWGIYDMLGNVAEWTLDQYREDYFTTIRDHPRNPHITVEKKYPVTLKGGHFRSEAAALRPASRLPSDRKWNARDPQIPKSKWWIADAPFVGFRIVRPLKQPAPEEVQAFFEKVLNP